MDAARTAFAERGYPATRVDDITRAAGTSHGAFYLYFANKQDIMEALADETSTEMFALADKLEGIAPGEAGYEHLRRWIAEFIDIYERNSAVVAAVTVTHSSGFGIVRNKKASSTRWLKRLGNSFAQWRLGQGGCPFSRAPIPPPRRRTRVGRASGVQVEAK